MLQLPQDIWTEWSFPLLPATGIVVLATLYLWGWRKASRYRPHELPTWRVVSFFGGLAMLWIALASPIDALDDALLAAHMIQHFLLMSVVPPLIVLGAPAVPVLRALQGPLVRNIIGPMLRQRWVERLLHVLGHPLAAWLAMNLTYLGWHIPAAFELTLHSETWHNFEHLCFFTASLVFWWHVIAPWPYRQRCPRWAMLPYLLSADIVNTILSALLTFSGRVFYPSYSTADRVTTLSPLQDQVAAGSEMWVLNSLIFLAPAFVITLQLLKPRGLKEIPTETLSAKRISI